MPTGAASRSPFPAAIRTGLAAAIVCAVGATLLLPSVQALAAGLLMPMPILGGAILFVTTLGAWAAIVRPSLVADQPVEEMPRLEDIVVSPAADSDVSGTTDAGERLPGQKYILLAEDDPATRLAAQAMMVQAGHIVDTCADGESAISRAMESKYDAVIMDIRMPNMSGVEACKALHALIPEEQRPQLIAMTSHAGEGARERFRAAGFDDLLTKPLMLNFLARALAKGTDASETSAQDDVATLDPPGSASIADDTFVIRAQSPDVRDENAAKAAEMLRALIRTHVTELVGEEDPEFVHELTDTFTESARGLLERTQAAVEAQDLDGIRTAAHQLRGSASNVGLRVIGEAWTPVETAARGGDEAGVQAALPNAFHKTRRALEFLAAD